MSRRIIKSEVSAEAQLDTLETQISDLKEDIINKDYNELISWLSAQLKDLQKYSNLSSDPSFHELNDCLAHYEGIMLGMVSSYNILKFEAQLAEREYNETFGEVFTNVREENNPKDLAATKYLGQKEIEYIVRYKYKHILNPLENKVTKLNLKVSALRSMIDSWNTFNYTLSTISRNVQIEAQLARTTKTELLDVDGAPVPF